MQKTFFFFFFFFFTLVFVENLFWVQRISSGVDLLPLMYRSWWRSLFCVLCYSVGLSMLGMIGIGNKRRTAAAAAAAAAGGVLCAGWMCQGGAGEWEGTGAVRQTDRGAAVHQLEADQPTISLFPTSASSALCRWYPPPDGRAPRSPTTATLHASLHTAHTPKIPERAGHALLVPVYQPREKKTTTKNN